MAQRAPYKTGCPCCAGKKACPDNNLEFLRPSLAKEWHFEKNSPLLPSEVMPNHNKKVWWICEFSHPYDATCNNRNYGKGCPYCSGHRVGYGNSLADLSPTISKEWVIELNGEKTPKNTLNGSGYKAWWLCKNGHYYHKRVIDRTGKKKGNCPHCPGRGLNRNYNPPDIEKIIRDCS